MGGHTNREPALSRNKCESPSCLVTWEYKYRDGWCNCNARRSICVHLVSGFCFSHSRILFALCNSRPLRLDNEIEWIELVYGGLGWGRVIIAFCPTSRNTTLEGFIAVHKSIYHAKQLLSRCLADFMQTLHILIPYPVSLSLSALTWESWYTLCDCSAWIWPSPGPAGHPTSWAERW